ncbi:MAG: class I SAM-dependent RNA methyltransferase, partial [Lachnospiraceae bacterium]|nr:class I SAM-dependent RNA methyltransferase [Lachnospiraceae bacterium]
MSKYELIAPCHFGMEAVLKKEIMDLGYEISAVEDGKVYFTGDEEAIVRANIFLRTAERILIKTACFQATTYDELFEGVKA